MGGSASAPPPPDTTRFSDAAMDDSQTMRGWAEEMWDTGQQEWGKLQDWSQEFMGMALPAMEDSFSWAKEQRQRFDEYVIPQMQSLFSEAETYASKAEEDRQRGAAIQDVNAATEAQRAAQLRKLEGYGVEVGDTREMALDRQAGVAQAAMQALAANQAGERTKQIGRDLRTEAINTGSQFLADASGANQVGSQIGAQGLYAATGATGTGARVAQGAMPYMAGAMGGTDLAAGIVDTSYGREIDYSKDQRDASGQDFDQWMSVGESIGQVADGGVIQGPGGPTDDAGAVAISDGEYVIPADVVKKLGTNHFDKMIEKETGRPPPGGKQAIPIPQVQGVF